MTVALLGFGWDKSSSYARGPALAPTIIRSVLFSDASSTYSLSGVNVREVISSFNFPSMPEHVDDCRKVIREVVNEAIDSGARPLSLGGDHSISYPILCAIKQAYGPVNVLHIDAHPDLYDEFEGDRYSHACPFARALEANCIQNLVQVGLRSVSPAQRAFARKHDVVMLGADANAVEQIPYAKLVAPLYITIDLDGLDPAFAPGVSHPEPGGLSTRDVLSIFKKLEAPPIGADVVELNPEKDVNLATAMVAGRLVKELLAMLSINR